MKTRILSLLVGAVLWCAKPTLAADCRTATVASGNDCFSIAQAAKITTDQLLSFNPGLNCSALAIGQKLCISAGTLPGQPHQNPDGSCATYKTVAGDSCSAIAVKFSITTANIETWNAKTFQWKGCAVIQVGFTMCVSSGTPPPPPIIPGTQCGPQSTGNATCPLNACCSAFGFCGLTNDFCATTGTNPCISHCGLPTLPSCASSRAMRKIGYYAGWGNRRACGVNVAPDQIDWTGFTGAHFAFASISQGLQIQLDTVDAPLLSALVAQKKRYPGLQVIIAVGGWAFSEADPTRDLFSFMISTSSTRATFISSVKEFLTQFGLDGIDIDFEYPGATERSAPATDTPNLTSFFRELRAALPTQIISCATPAGYWFLRGFEIDKIAASVSYLNMMSYDYHGPWDTNVTGQASAASPHTSILDMHDSAALYVRAGINLANVNLGLAYYGRDFQLASASCTGYNCTMTGGGFAGNCTSASGILAQFEIDSLGAAPTLDKATQTYWFDKSGSLVTFDQKDTWAAKTSFAASSCFGGTFIWSLDQVTSNPGAGGGIISSGGTSGSGSGHGSGGTFTFVEWNPNPFPSPNAVSETFVQSPGVVLSTATSVVSKSTLTTTQTLVIPAFTTVTTSFTAVSGTFRTITGTHTVLATTSTETVTVTKGSTITSVTAVTKTATTIVIPVPKTTTTVNVEGVILTLNSGGTPINSPVPTYISQPSAITPTFTQNVSPTPNATIIVYTAPLTSPVTWSSTVTIPPKSTSPPVIVAGPPGGRSRCGGTVNVWSILSGGIISGCPPADVGIINGITPVVAPPPNWTGSWSNPFNLPTGVPDPVDRPTSTTTTTTSASSTSAAACPIRTEVYNFSDDPENADWSGLGTDPDRRRKRDLTQLHSNRSTLVRRAPRKANTPCGITLVSPAEVNLGRGHYYVVVRSDGGYTSTFLHDKMENGKPDDDQQGETNQEHVFEIGYLNKFLTALATATGTGQAQVSANCVWITRDIINYRRRDGTLLGASLLAAIDNLDNMVWADKPMNQAKSNIVLDTRPDPNDPPQSQNTRKIIDFTSSEEQIYMTETFLRNFAALGQYFDQTSSFFQDVAAEFQQLLSEVTPGVILDNTRSLPVLFNDWLRATVSGYPDACTERAFNAWDYYRNRMDTIARLTNNGVGPACAPLYNANIYNPSTFDFEDLLPMRPPTASCNVPGTLGNIGYIGGGAVVRSIPRAPSPQRIMGAGNLDYYAVGSGMNITDLHYVAIQAGGPGCTTAVLMINSFSSNPAHDANIDLQCAGSTGRQEVNFNFVVNGQTLACAASPSSPADIACSTNQLSALACMGPNAFPVQMRWFPL